MFWYGLLLVALAFLCLCRRLANPLRKLIEHEILPLRVIPDKFGVRKLYFTPYPYLDGLYFLFIFQKHGLSLLDRLARDLPLEDQMYEFDLGPFKVMGSRDASINYKVLSSSDPGHLSRPKYLEEHAFFLKNGLLFTPSKTWTSQRKLASRAFTFRCIQSYTETIDIQSKHLIQTMFKTIRHNSTGTICGEELDKLISRSTLIMTLEFIMGSNTEISNSKEAIEYSYNLFKFKEIASYHVFHPECHLPLVWWLHPKRRQLEILEKRMLAFVKKVIEHYEQKSDIINAGDTVTKKCLVEEIIKCGASNEEIFNEIATFLVVGHKTVTAAMSLLLHHLACHQEYQDRCRNEIDDILDKNFSSLEDDTHKYLDMDKLSKLEYLDRFILESLRIAPTAPFTARELEAPLKINEELTLQPGQLLVISPWAIHHNPKYYPKPEIFDPDRFLPTEVEKREPGAYIPFSAGYRNCIGRRVAMLELKILTAWILRNFQITTEEDSLHDDVKLGYEISLKPERSYRTVLKIRSDR